MKTNGLILLFLIIHAANGLSQAARLLPDNNRYLEYHGSPVVLITSAEHYGAVINAEFDFRKYLSELETEGFNYTRIFTGTYLEPVENIFGITKNTLAPLPGKYVSPWSLSKGIYDLNKFNNAYFDRLKDFIREAGRRNIIVEVTLFSSIYHDNAWKLSPFYFKNNCNKLDSIPLSLANTLFNKGLINYQIAFIKKLVNELNDFDNLFFEIQNEPWSDNPCLVNYVNLSNDSVFSNPWQTKVEIANPVSLQWQQKIAETIIETEKGMKNQHLIAENISNFEYAVNQSIKGISILNFHYASPHAVLLNNAVMCVKSLDETGFMPHKSELYIDQAWRFILAGGGVYNNLDYSFIVGNEDGTWKIPDGNPGWGGPAFRKQLSYLAAFMKKLPFYEMNYCDTLICSEKKIMQTGLMSKNGIYGVFLEDIEAKPLQVKILPGDYIFKWLNVYTGEVVTEEATIDSRTWINSPFPCKVAALMINLKP